MSNNINSGSHTTVELETLPNTELNGRVPGIDVIDARSQRRPARAVPELDDDDDDDRAIVTEKRFGVDDGLLPDGSTAPSGLPAQPRPPVARRPSFSFDFGSTANGSGYGFVDIDGVQTAVPDVNAYQHKKTLAQGMMDLALLSANANQLRYVLESFTRHPYYYASVIFISLSIIFQVLVGVGLILNGRYNIKNKAEACRANKINNYTVIGIFIVTVVNVFISAFGVASREQPLTVAVSPSG